MNYLIYYYLGNYYAPTFFFLITPSQDTPWAIYKFT